MKKLKVGDTVLVDGDARGIAFGISKINYKRNKAWIKDINPRYVWQYSDNATSIDLDRLVLAETVPGCVYYKPEGQVKE